MEGAIALLSLLGFDVWAVEYFVGAGWVSWRLSGKDLKPCDRLSSLELQNAELVGQ